MEITFIDCDVNIYEAEQAPIIEGGEDACCKDECTDVNGDIDVEFIYPVDLVITAALEEELVSLADEFEAKVYECYRAHGWVETVCECEDVEFCDCKGAEGTE